MKAVGGPWLVGVLIALVFAGCSGMRHPQGNGNNATSFPHLSPHFSIHPPAKSFLQDVLGRDPSSERPPVIISRELGDIETGFASWYGPGFHGKRTANGEIYNQYALTAAHPTLPLGTIVEVTNLETEEAIKVRINDRGPYKYGRIIDLSYEAALRLGILEPGIAPVRVMVLNSDGTLPRERVLKASAYAVLLASSTDINEGTAILRAISRKYTNAYLTELSSGALLYYQVRVGPFRSRREAQVRAREITRRGILALVVAEEDRRAAW